MRLDYLKFQKNVKKLKKKLLKKRIARANKSRLILKQKRLEYGRNQIKDKKEYTVWVKERLKSTKQIKAKMFRAGHYLTIFKL